MFVYLLETPHKQINCTLVEYRFFSKYNDLKGNI